MTYLALSEIFKGLPLPNMDYDTDIRDLPYLGHYPLDESASSLGEADVSLHWGSTYPK